MDPVHRTSLTRALLKQFFIRSMERLLETLLGTESQDSGTWTVTASVTLPEAHFTILLQIWVGCEFIPVKREHSSSNGSARVALVNSDLRSRMQVMSTAT
jgi:hypothetical protein